MCLANKLVPYEDGKRICLSLILVTPQGGLAILTYINTDQASKLSVSKLDIWHRNWNSKIPRVRTGREIILEG